MRSPGRAPPRHIPMVPAGPPRFWRATGRGVTSQPVRLSIMAAALLFVSSSCPLVRTTCMHPRPTRSRITPQGHGMGGEAERRLHFRHGPPPPQGKGDAVSPVWALSRQVLPTGRRLAGGSRGLGPWPDPPSLPRARHF